MKIPFNSQVSVVSFTKVRLPWGWLGNMAPFPVIYQDIRWPTTEHLFQALRYHSDDYVRGLILGHSSPMRAKMESKRHIARRIVHPMTEADVENMRMCLKLKLEQHPDLRPKLLESGKAFIVEDCSARATLSGLFWGMELTFDEGWYGTNTLGNLWMQLRDRLTS